MSVLGQRISSTNQPNYCYLALDAMQRMAHIPAAALQVLSLLALLVQKYTY